MVLNHNIYPDYPFPTLERLGIDPSSTFIDPINLTIKAAQRIAQDWLDSFSKSISNRDVNAMVDLIMKEGWWRDMLAFTWDFRTFYGEEKIRKFLFDRLDVTQPTSLILDMKSITIGRPYPDIIWISLSFTFKTAVGHASSITRLMPTSNGTWKAHTVYSNLEGLIDFPDQVGHLRSFAPNHGKWATARAREVEFKDGDPQVLIVGAGQSGLAVAASLKVLGVSALIVEKNERVGDNWRGRYEALCLHDPVWFDHMPYLPFPPNWPVYTPAQKLANWLEFYADTMELNVWTSATVTSIAQVPGTSSWNIIVLRKRIIDGEEVYEDTKMTVCHVVMATGLGSGVPNTPKYPGMGKILHSTQHKKAADHIGKKIVVVGSGTSAHDIAVDYYEHGIDVTMFQRGSSSTYIMSCNKGWEVLSKGTYWEGALPLEECDRQTASWPSHIGTELTARKTRMIAESVDKDLLEGLHKVGFRTNLGIKDTGFSVLARTKAPSILDTGASQLIVDGKIKLKATSEIESFTERSIKFEDGSQLEADVVIFATGLGEPKDQILRIAGPVVASRTKPIWGFDKEGELNGIWRELGVPGLWSMMGNLAFCRFHSRHVALQIKAMLAGKFGERYSAE